MKTKAYKRTFNFMAYNCHDSFEVQICCDVCIFRQRVRETKYNRCVRHAPVGEDWPKIEVNNFCGDFEYDSDKIEQSYVQVIDNMIKAQNE